MSTVGTVVYALVAVGALLTTARIVRGPSLLDRVVAIDTLLFLVSIGLAARAGLARETAVLPVVVAASLLGFLGSVGVARYIGGVLVDSEDDGRDVGLPPAAETRGQR